MQGPYKKQTCQQVVWAGQRQHLNLLYPFLSVTYASTLPHLLAAVVDSGAGNSEV